jgi:hypothetical protein
VEKPSLSQRLIEAGSACGEVAGILDIAYLRDAHQRRQRIFEAANSAALDGRPTDPERVYAFLGGIPLQASRHVWGEDYAAQIFHALIDPGASELGQEALALLASARDRAGGDFLATAALLFRRPEGNTTASRLALALALQKSAGPAEPAMSAVLHGLEAARGRSMASFDLFMSAAFHKASIQSRDRARGLRASIAACLGALKGDRASSSIHQIAALLFAGHPLSYSGAADRFGISRGAAVGHLSRLVELGLAEPATRRKSGQIFVARDGVMTFQAPSPPRPDPAKTRLKVSTPHPLTPEERAQLGAISDDVGARVAELDRLLERLSSTRSNE